MVTISNGRLSKQKIEKNLDKITENKTVDKQNAIEKVNYKEITTPTRQITTQINKRSK